MLLDVAKLCVEWQLMGKYLKLTEAAVYGDKGTVEEKRIAMLGKWGKGCLQTYLSGSD